MPYIIGFWLIHDEQVLHPPMICLRPSDSKKSSSFIEYNAVTTEPSWSGVVFQETHVSVTYLVKTSENNRPKTQPHLTNSKQTRQTHGIIEQQ